MKTVYAVTWSADYLGFNDPDISFEDVEDAHKYMKDQPKSSGGSWEVSSVLVFDSLEERINFSEDDYDKWYDEQEEIRRQAYRKVILNETP